MAGFQHPSSIVRDLPSKSPLPSPVSHRRPNQSDDIYEVGDIEHRKTTKCQPIVSPSRQNPQTDEIRFQLSQDNAGGYDTPISQLVTKFKLPAVVEIQKDFPVAQNGPSLKAGEPLWLHFIGQQRRVPAKDELGKKAWLYFDDTQLYEILPHDQALDLKQFYGTDAVIQNNPLPKRLRIVKMSPKYKEEHGLNEGDILEISHVESGTQNSKTTDLLALVGSCNGKQFLLTQHTTDIIYSTIVLKESLPLSAIVERNLSPVRLRQTNGNRVYLLLQEPESVELQVIATRMGHDRVLAIPLSCPIQMKRTANDGMEELLQGMLPAMYSLVHYNGKVQKVGEKSSKGKPPPKGSKPVALPYSKKHSSILENTRVPSPRSKATTYVQLKERYSQDQPNIKPRMKPKPKPAMRSKSFVTPRRKPVELFQVYDDASSLDVSSCEPEETQPIYDDASSFGSSRPDESEETQPIYDDVPSLVILPPGPEEAQKICDKAFSLEVSSCEPEESHPTYDDTSVSVLPDRTNTSPFLNRKAKSRLEQNCDRKSVGDEHSLRSASVDEVADFLRQLHFDKWIDKFRAASIDGELLCQLDETYLLRDMGMKRIETKRLVLAVRKATTQYSEGQGDLYDSDTRVRRTKSLSMKHTHGQSMILFKKQNSGEV